MATENAWASIADTFRLFTPTGELNSRARAEEIMAAALPALTGPQWAKTKRALARPQLLMFLDHTHAQLAALPLSPTLRNAAVQAEGLRQRPEKLREGGSSSSALRGVLVAASLVLTMAATRESAWAGVACQ